MAKILDSLTILAASTRKNVPLSRRLIYDSVRSEQSGMGWSTDYPHAGINFMIRLSELTKTDVSMDGEGEPNH